MKIIFKSYFPIQKCHNCIPQNCKCKKFAQNSFTPQKMYFEWVHSLISETH